MTRTLGFDVRELTHYLEYLGKTMIQFIEWVENKNNGVEKEDGK